MGAKKKGGKKGKGKKGKKEEVKQEETGAQDNCREYVRLCRKGASIRPKTPQVSRPLFATVQMMCTFVDRLNACSCGRAVGVAVEPYWSRDGQHYIFCQLLKIRGDSVKTVDVGRVVMTFALFRET